MIYKIKVSPTASKNIANAIEYYLENGNKKIATEFIKDYKLIYKALQLNPFYRFHDNNHRFLPFSKFPFIAFFIIDVNIGTVYINAVFHTSQSPEKYPML